jgi:hypothetical protein
MFVVMKLVNPIYSTFWFSFQYEDGSLPLFQCRRNGPFFLMDLFRKSRIRKLANLRSGSETLLFFLQICGLEHQGNLRIAICGLIIKNFGFAICVPSHLRNLRICDCGMSPRICGFASCELTRKVCVPTFAF